ncbi:VOC family protein [Massilia scottii]|uniref:VOC family protein n=1 Tax=Massilia scottii TaxID=3057166 RepID=UPI0027968FE3|nr:MULTISPECIES: VOC family protein [unclassified Massilia]MDQ1815502.1 VOC family protein [Massilia sp. CCM 9210]MDQ1835036.1 VOC family protein [Massilia sp. CCM 9029]
MSTQAVQRIPEDMHTVTPHIVCADAVSAIDFYVKAFGATDTGKMLAPNGKLIHGMIRIGDSAIMLAEETPEWGAIGPLTLKGSPVTLHLYVQDADAAFQRAIDAGATAVMPPSDTFWGDRYGVVKDPYGHSWSIAHHMRDMTMEEMQEGAAKACGEPGA